MDAASTPACPPALCTCFTLSPAQPGALVEFEKNDKPVLAVVSGPDGKKNWFVVDQVRTAGGGV